jgi:hypothetical protein
MRARVGRILNRRLAVDLAVGVERNGSRDFFNLAAHATDYLTSR